MAFHAFTTVRPFARPPNSFDLAGFDRLDGLARQSGG
jgi:hypothetical protein